MQELQQVAPHGYRIACEPLRRDELAEHSVVVGSGFMPGPKKGDPVVEYRSRPFGLTVNEREVERHVGQIGAWAVVTEKFPRTIQERLRLVGPSERGGRGEHPDVDLRVLTETPN